MIKALLVDFDGVLSKEELFSERLAREYGITTDITDSFFTTRFQLCLVGNADLKQEIKPYLHHWGWEKSIDEFLQFWFVCERVVDELLISAIQQLRQAGILCYIVTNQEKYRTDYIMYKLDFSKKFDGIFSSSYIKHLKEDPEFFRRVLYKLPNLRAQEILLIDDSFENIAAAKQVGLHAQICTTFVDFEKIFNTFFSS